MASKKPLARVLATFGTASDGRLGLGFPIARELYPRIVACLAGYSVQQVSCGGAHTAVVTDDGTLLTFGLNDKGQLGHSREDKFVAAPIEVGLPDPVMAVAAGGSHTLALTTAGEVWGWGMAGEGALGIGDPDQGRQVEPRLVKHLTGQDVVALAAGDHHSLALTKGGEVLSWGRGDHGALGHGAVHGHVGVEMLPKKVRALAGARIASIAAGPFSSGALDREGSAWGWGYGNSGQLGTGRYANELQPVELRALPSGLRSLALGQLHSLAVLATGEVASFGMDSHGSLGAGQATLRTRQTVAPKIVPGLPPCRAVAVGWHHSAAVAEDGRLFTWGASGAAGQGRFQDYGGGQLGLGDDEDRWSPEQVFRLHTSAHRFYDLRTSYIKAQPWRVKQISAGRNHTAAVIETPLDTRDLAS
ncbi:hypothetical protein HYH03_013851 [Edaphochlamys debaryana]|uniref:RCC1-like domain-containing protein n=1 Tax=Edaphochlamys debaryana TaxID=47281 RepID=A0A836BSX9_9CHLO|nr:hypothetical protein HYH03_013851 [Edaphochlamys debaryana]|eukprot:KAG2487572.1 hypothetical protein HYH03_013851 [Edaphochlamys debaryana]